MTSKLSPNKKIDKAIAEALSVAEDFKERMMAINASIKWEAVKMKMQDNDFGTHFLDEKDEANDTDIDTSD